MEGGALFSVWNIHVVVLHLATKINFPFDFECSLKTQTKHHLLELVVGDYDMIEHGVISVFNNLHM
jgi:hypothetical protein